MKQRAKWLIGFVMACFVCLILIPNATVQAGNSQMKIHAIYLGKENGDAILLESKGKYLLMDMGTKSSYTKVRDYLKSLGVTQLSLYYSHFHADHTGGLKNGEGFDKITTDFTIDKIYLPDEAIASKLDLSWSYEKISSIFTKKYPNADAESAIVYLNVGSSFTIGDASIGIIGPINPGSFKYNPKESLEDDDYENNCSLVAKITCGNTTYLTAGDTKTEGENTLIKKYGAQLKADIYKMSHHGLAPANSEKIMSYLQPGVSFGSNGDFTELTTYGDGTKRHRRTYSSRENCSQYGFVYMLGEEKKTLIVDVNNNVINLYRSGSSVKLNKSGWTKVYGSDGVYQEYNYYYFGSNGKPLTGVQTIDGKTYYLGIGGCREDGTYAVENGKTVYKGWKNYEGSTKRRYFVQGTAEMAVGFQWIDDKYYYFDKQGVLLTGDKAWSLKKIGSSYYAVYTSGMLKNNKWYTYPEGRRYFDKKGKMATGWKTIDGKTYYLNPKTGYCAVGYTKIGKNRYYFSDYGTQYRNAWLTFKDGIVYFGTDGKQKTGWYTGSGKRFYFEPETGYMTRGLAKINSKLYYFDGNGMMCKNQNIIVDGKEYNFGSNGAMTNAPKVSKVTIKKAKAGIKKALVQWKKNTKVDGYEIYIADGKKAKYKLKKTLTKQKTSYTITGLKKGKTYYIKMRAYKKIGNIKIYSSYSSVSRVTSK